MVKLISQDQKLQNERVKWIVSGLIYDNLTEWEQGYVESIGGQLDQGKMLTEKQMDILERICKEKGK